MSDRTPGPSGDPGHAPWDNGVWYPPQMPQDVRRIGLDRNTVEGAWIEFATVLDRSRPSHVVVAWLALAIFVLPLVLTVASLVRS